MQVALENEQALSAYVTRANAGEEVVLTREGRPVARIIPEQTEADQQHSASVDRLMTLLVSGYDLGGVRVDRDELYDRGH